MSPFAEPALGYAILGLVAAERLAEVVVDRRHVRPLLDGGARLGGSDMAPMVAFHSIWIAATAAERLFLGARLAAAGEREVLLPLLGLALALRAWVFVTLGSRWTVRVVVRPGESPVARGPYRFLRHPNYLVVVAEVALVPLLVGAWRTALVASLVHLAVIRRRVRIEERAWLSIARVPPGRLVPHRSRAEPARLSPP